MYLLGERIKKLRTGRKMTQEILAQRLGVTKAMISAYENSTRCPSYEVLIALSRVFSVSTDYLLGCTSNKVLNVSGLDDEQISLLSNLIQNMSSK